MIRAIWSAFFLAATLFYFAVESGHCLAQAKPASYPTILKFGELRLKPVTVRIERPKLRTVGGEREGTEEHLVFTVQLSNTSKTERVSFPGWPIGRKQSNCSAIDDRGNKYLVVAYPIGMEPLGDEKGDVIEPRKVRMAVIVFEKPADTAKTYTVTLKGDGVGLPADQEIQWTLKRSDWSR